MDAVPSVMESPKPPMALVDAGALISTASKKNHDAVEKGNAASTSSLALEPALGAVTYEVVNAFACHVIGPLDPGI